MSSNELEMTCGAPLMRKVDAANTKYELMSWYAIDVVATSFHVAFTYPL